MQKLNKNTKIYTTGEKKKIAVKIGKIKSKEYGKKIFDIITDDIIKFTDNENGIFILANKLKDDTFYRLECFLKEISRELRQKKEARLTTEAETTSSNDKTSASEKDSIKSPNANEESIATLMNNYNTQKLSNKDRKFIQKYKYYRESEVENENVVYYDDLKKTEEAKVVIDLKSKKAPRRKQK